MNNFLVNKEWIVKYINNGYISNSQLEILGIQKIFKGWLDRINDADIIISNDDKLKFERLCGKDNFNSSIF